MSGIYCIKVDKAIVYVGKSKDIDGRVCQHWRSILSSEDENKYSLLHDAHARKHYITFWLLESVENINELDKAEQSWISFLQPCLNTQHAGGLGHRLTANEFYNIVLNEEHYVEGASEWHYEKNWAKANNLAFWKNKYIERSVNNYGTY